MKILNKIMLGAIFTPYLLMAQSSEINFGNFDRPVPSVSSLPAYINSSMSNATGIPDISIPLLPLPASNTNVNLSTGLSYNPLNVDPLEPASQSGTGWSLFAGSVISRNIVDNFDEFLDDISSPKYQKNEFNDIYYYNLPDASGKMRFIRNVANNTFELVNLSTNKLKISYVPENNTATLIIKSFTITTPNGIQYIFNDYSRSNQDLDNIIEGRVYRSAFFLTQIKDADNKEVANFTYQKDIKYKSNSATPRILYETCKLKTITSPGIGKIEFSYIYDPALENTMNDPYSVEKIVLKDSYGHIISGYAFEYDQWPYNVGSKRILKKLKKLDRNLTAVETTAFEYSNIQTTIQTPSVTYPDFDMASLCPKYSEKLRIDNSGLLKKIINPTGGVVEYNFEPHRVYFNRADPSYLNTILHGDDFVDPEVQYLKTFAEIHFDTNQTTNYSFTVTGSKSKKVFISFAADEYYPLQPHWDPDTPPYVDYVVGSYATCGLGTHTREFELSPGTHTLQITGTGGKGSAQLMEIAHLPLPLNNSAYTRGVRIGSIKHYNSLSDTTPVSTTQFAYNNFLDPNNSSGYQYHPGMASGADYTVLYKNVKITNSQSNNGYTKYYYKTPDDYPKESYGVNKEYWPYYAFTSGGLMDKKEIYNDQNKLLVSEQSSYTFETIPGAADHLLFENVYSKLSWLKKTTNVSTTYFENGRNVQESSETEYTAFNFLPKSTKKNVDGRIEEKLITYPETGYTNLSTAYILNTAVAVEGKINGNLVSRTETKFGNAASTLPTSVTTSNIGNTAQKTATIDLYDERGNVLQYTTSDGDVMTTIYGYNKSLPIATIEGATYTQVFALVQAILNASDADAADPSKESQLLVALDTFRNNSQLKDFQITTYTYDPMIGATTITPPNGLREIYKYDIQNRLERVVDMKGRILKEYKYNYKN